MLCSWRCIVGFVSKHLQQHSSLTRTPVSTLQLRGPAIVLVVALYLESKLHIFRSGRRLEAVVMPGAPKHAGHNFYEG